MTAPPPIKDTWNRPPLELVGGTADTITPTGTGGGGGVGGSSGRVAVVGEFGDGTDAATVIAGEYGDIPPVPFGITFDTWYLLAYSASGDPESCSAVVDIQVSDFASNSFASICGTEKPTLSGGQAAASITLAGWVTSHPVNTMYRVVLVSVSGGAPAKIIMGAQGAGL